MGDVKYTKCTNDPSSRPKHKQGGIRDFSPVFDGCNARSFSVWLIAMPVGLVSGGVDRPMAW